MHNLFGLENIFKALLEEGVYAFNYYYLAYYYIFNALTSNSSFSSISSYF